MMRYLLFGLCLVFSVHFVRGQNTTVTNPTTASTTISTTAVASSNVTGVVTNSTSITFTTVPTSSTTTTVGGVLNSTIITTATVPTSSTTTTVGGVLNSTIITTATVPTSSTTTTVGGVLNSTIITTATVPTSSTTTTVGGVLDSTIITTATVPTSSTTTTVGGVLDSTIITTATVPTSSTTTTVGGVLDSTIITTATVPTSSTTTTVASSNVSVTSNDTDGATTPATTSTVDDITTTTPTPTPTVDPCAGQCNFGQECGSDCECVNGYVKSLSSVCADPCNPAYAWCYEGVECQPSENNMGYECVGCPPAYYENEEGDCLQGKTFGGEITFENDFDETDQEQTKKDVEEILNGIYNESESFVKSVVSNVREGSIIATYDLIYKDDERVTDETVQKSFESQTNCSAGNTVNNTDYAINCTGSLNTVIIPGQACKSAGYCDLSTTNCEDTNGRYYCRCKDDTFAKVTPTAQECFKIPCMSSSDCNDPFGTCKNGTDNSADVLQHYCSCMWGFAGSDCSDPWMFVFTVSTSALGLILIIVVTVCICNSTKSKSKNKKGEMHDDMNLKNPFVDFQPGLVRAKVPANMYSVSDTFDMGETNGGRQSHTNNAYSHAYDEVSPKNANGQGGGADYF
uniref:protein HEG homolog 1-like n=1 Tax=Styela clava TaxID=7725 RepID=UPI00193A1E2D|nr:protein HEG homolog 1-like [Styela clava]